VAFKRRPALARSQEAYDRFSVATNLPLLSRAAVVLVNALTRVRGSSPIVGCTSS
jgi:hypothetical protein